MSRSFANALLLMAAIAWGSVFIAQEWAADLIGPFGFNAIRFGIGAGLLIPLALWEYRRSPLNLSKLEPKGLMLLFGLGLFLSLGSVAQQLGIAYTTTANSGFLTTLYVPMVPFIALLFLRQKVRAVVWPAVALCLTGTYVLAGGANIAGDQSQLIGDLATVVCALLFAVHILMIQTFMKLYPCPFQASFYQALIAALLALPIALTWEGMNWSIVYSTLTYTTYAGFMAVFLGFTFQMIGQRYTGPSTAAIILSLEAVFAALFGWLILSEALSLEAAIGCGLIFAGVVLVETWPSSKKPESEAA